MQKYEVEVIVAEGAEFVRIVEADFCSIQADGVLFTTERKGMVAFFSMPFVRCVRSLS